MIDEHDFYCDDPAGPCTCGPSFTFTDLTAFAEPAPNYYSCDDPNSCGWRRQGKCSCPVEPIYTDSNTPAYHLKQEWPSIDRDEQYVRQYTDHGFREQTLVLAYLADHISVYELDRRLSVLYGLVF